jgi:enediyne biosynthesis protein E4
MRHLLRWIAAFALLSTATFGVQQRNEPVQFVNVASKNGITYKHENGATAEKYMPETMASGALIFDYNNDGWQDLLFINGGSFVDKRVAAAARHRLYKNMADGKFTDVTESSGIGVSGFGMGACSADYDNDGWVDLYITSVGPDKLYRNTGKNAFADVSADAGLGEELWSTSCAFGDVDNDGDVDLYVARYVDFSIDNNKFCTLFEAVRAYCHPHVYNSVPDILYRNNGNGTFTDISREAGVTKAGNGLGVVFGDYDDDGWIDIFVANDSSPNFLYHNKGKGVFEELGFWAGVAVGADGKPLAGMGTDMGDINGDGILDIFVTNLDGQTHSLYQNLGKGLFNNVSFLSGIGEVTLPYVGFGTAFFDYDNDTDLDLSIANGDVIDNIKRLRDSTSYEQLNLLLRNDGIGKFTSVGPASGPGFALKKPSRGLVTGDLDNDGDLDVVVSNVGTTADVLQNDGGNRSHSILVRTIGSKSNRDGIGARLRLFVGNRILRRDVKAGSSYLGQNDLRVHFGLGQSDRADRLEIRWPGGAVETIENIAANQMIAVKEGEGVISRQPFVR